MNRNACLILAAYRTAVALFAVLLLRPAWAEVIERVEVVPAAGDAEIRIHFATTIQYTRHFPLGESDFFRIFFRVTGGGDEGITVATRETHTPPTNGLTVPFTVTYPEEGGTVGVRFERAVRLRVRVGADNRSLSLLLPALPAAAQPAPAPLLPPRPAAGAAAPAAATAEVEKQARQLMDEAQAALVRNDPVAATDLLNRLLNLPPNSLSEQAQELIGVAAAGGLTARGALWLNSRSLRGRLTQR